MSGSVADTVADSGSVSDTVADSGSVADTVADTAAAATAATTGDAASSLKHINRNKDVVEKIRDIAKSLDEMGDKNYSDMPKLSDIVIKELNINTRGSSGVDGAIGSASTAVVNGILQAFNKAKTLLGPVPSSTTQNFRDNLTPLYDKATESGGQIFSKLKDVFDKVDPRPETNSNESPNLNTCSFQEFLLGKLNGLSFKLPKCKECKDILTGQEYCSCKNNVKYDNQQMLCSIDMMRELSDTFCLAKKLKGGLTKKFRDDVQTQEGGGRTNYNTITDPLTNKQYNITSKRGQDLINRYILEYNSFILKNIYEE
tara:strand:+ start:36 stop:977 length:942 start_codon:yes stop_codon:yes gene_type:complete